MKIAAALIGIASATMIYAAHDRTAAAATEELPVRKAGQWRLKTVSDTTGLKSFDTCISASDNIATGSNKKNCGKPEVKRIGNEIFVNVVCKAGDGTEKISTLYTGDFEDWYRGVTKITFDPPQAGLAHLGVIVDGKYLGPKCDVSGTAAMQPK